MLVSDLKTILYGDTDDSVDPSLALSWLNAGYEYLQQDVIIPSLETTAALTFTAGLANLPDDFMHLVELVAGATTYTEEINYEQRNTWQGDRGFYYWGEKIGTVPAATGSGTLAYVQQAPALVLDADSPKLPPLFHRLIAEYAKGLYRENAGNYAKATVHFNNVDNGILKLTGKLRQRTRRKSTAWSDIRDNYPTYP